MSIERIPKIPSKMFLELMKDFNKVAGIKVYVLQSIKCTSLAINVGILILKKVSFTIMCTHTKKY